MLGFCLQVSAETTLEGGRWQLPVGRGSQRVWHEVDVWLLPPGARITVAPRLLLAVRSASSRAEEAVLLRYVVSARLARKQGGEGTWTVPFLLEDRRVPHIRAGETRPVPVGLNRAVLGAYLQRMGRAGFWPDALRLQVTLEPRPGENSFEGRMLETVLPVLWTQVKNGGPR